MTPKPWRLHVRGNHSPRTDSGGGEPGSRGRAQHFRTHTDSRRARTGLSESRVKAPTFKSGSKLSSLPKTCGSLRYCDPSSPKLARTGQRQRQASAPPTCRQLIAERARRVRHGSLDRATDILLPHQGRFRSPLLGHSRSPAIHKPWLPIWVGRKRLRETAQHRRRRRNRTKAHRQRRQKTHTAF